MKRLLCPQIPRPGRKVPLNDTEANHATRVLRLSEGDLVEALDGSGKSVLARLRVRSGSVWLEYESDGTLAQPDQAHTPALILEIAVLKGEAMEWVVEKAVELNVQRFIPVLTAHTVVQMKHKGPAAFQERWKKIADQALKQCGRLDRMSVAEPIALEELLAREPASPEQPRFWCDEQARSNATPLLRKLIELPPATQAVRVLIGPEGGWSQLERDFLIASGVPAVSLGSLVLRAETAAIHAMSLISGAFSLRSNGAQSS